MIKYDGTNFNPTVRATKRPVTVDVMLVQEDGYIETLEGTMRVEKSLDVIIRGVNGELYPCKTEIFAKTYDFKVVEQEPSKDE